LDVKTSYIFILSLLALLLVQCQTRKPALSKDFNFNELTFHSSRCFGTCPDISLHIKADRSIELMRTLFIAGGVKDTLHSGGFKGMLNAKTYRTLIALLEGVDWENTKFPDVRCCDGAFRQILLTYNNQTHTYQSMTPPPTTYKLITFLTNLGATITLPAYDKPIDFEVIVD
jgi:hypothetical protein